MKTAKELLESTLKNSDPSLEEIENKIEIAADKGEFDITIEFPSKNNSSLPEAIREYYSSFGYIVEFDINIFRETSLKISWNKIK